MKQRLVGAIVLVALAVIFLPMVLDGSGNSGPRAVAIEIPAEPQPPSNRLETGTDAADRGKLAQPAGTTSSAAATPKPSSPAAGSGDGDEPSSRKPSAQAAAPVGASKQESDAQAGSGTTGTAPPDDAGASGQAEAEGPDAWVVQVGSFTRETNALVLRDRLREADFDAFAERAQTGERTVWRVRIGPVPTREEASKLSERVTTERGGPALVMTHP